MLDRVEALMAAARVADADGRADDAQQLRGRAETMTPSILRSPCSTPPTPTCHRSGSNKADAVQTTTDRQEARSRTSEPLLCSAWADTKRQRQLGNLSTALNAGGGGDELASLAVVLAAPEASTS